MIDRKASIIIRTKNEEKWIKPTLKGVVDQTYDDWEVILVDNESTDKTVEKAVQFPIEKVVTCTDYKPGKALNLGIQEAKGEYIVCLSGHCIPVDDHWLEKLKRNFDDPNVGGVYGRQEPLSFTPDKDKRDLNLVFGKEKIMQEKDNFFHNANSMIRRELWEECPFNEEISNLEDRLWAEEILSEGYKIVYEPEASVYHYHGIHHDGDDERAQNHVRILEKLSKDGFRETYHDPKELNIVTLIPSKGPSKYINGNCLCSYTIRQSLDYEFTDRTIVSTDNEETAEIARSAGADVPFIREGSLSEEYVDIQRVVSYTLEELEQRDIFPDLVVLMEPTFPFRPPGLINDMVSQFIEKGLDTLISGQFENKPIFTESDHGEIELIKGGITPRKFQSPTYVGLRGLGSVIAPEVIRQGNIYGTDIGIYNVESPLANIEVRDLDDINHLPMIKNALEKMNEGTPQESNDNC